jgi:hypothetical protein
VDTLAGRQARCLVETNNTLAGVCANPPLRARARDATLASRDSLRVGAMKVAIVGCGVEGSALAGYLAASEEVDSVTLVSRDGRRAESVASLVADWRPRTTVRHAAADASDVSALRSVVTPADVVVNAALPEVNIPIMQASLDVGAHYVDMCAYGYEAGGVSYSETWDACWEFDDRYRASDLLAIPNTGAAPGLTDLAAAYLASGMDTVSDAVARWGDRSDATDLIPPFTPEQVFSVAMPTPSVYRNGRIEPADIVRDSEVFDWPEPIGSLTMVPGAHLPDLRTLQFVLPQTPHIEVLTGVAIGPWDSWYKIWSEAVRRALADPELRAKPLPAALRGGIGVAADYFTAVTDKVVRSHAFGIAVTLTGVAQGEPVSRTLTVMTTLASATERVPWANAMSALTAGSTTLEVVLALGRAELSDRGVARAVGQLTERDLLMARLAAREFEAREEVTTKAGTVKSDGWTARPLATGGGDGAQGST